MAAKKLLLFLLLITFILQAKCIENSLRIIADLIRSHYYPTNFISFSCNKFGKKREKIISNNRKRIFRRIYRTAKIFERKGDFFGFYTNSDAIKSTLSCRSSYFNAEFTMPVHLGTCIRGNLR